MAILFLTLSLIVMAYLLFMIHVMGRMIQAYELQVAILTEKLTYINRHFEAQDRGDFYTPNMGGKGLGRLDGVISSAKPPGSIPGRSPF